jgi:hypothetical protein
VSSPSRGWPMCFACTRIWRQGWVATGFTLEVYMGVVVGGWGAVRVWGGLQHSGESPGNIKN